MIHYSDGRFVLCTDFSLRGPGKTRRTIVRVTYWIGYTMDCFDEASHVELLLRFLLE